MEGLQFGEVLLVWRSMICLLAFSPPSFRSDFFEGRPLLSVGLATFAAVALFSGRGGLQNTDAALEDAAEVDELLPSLKRRTTR